MAALTLAVGVIPVRASAFLSLYAGVVGDVLDFTVLSSDGATVLDLSGATLTWLAEDGRTRTLAVQSYASGLARYTTSLTDFPAPGAQRGQLRVSLASGQRLYTQPFVLTATPHL